MESTDITKIIVQLQSSHRGKLPQLKKCNHNKCDFMKKYRFSSICSFPNADQLAGAAKCNYSTSGSETGTSVKHTIGNLMFFVIAGHRSNN